MPEKTPLISVIMNCLNCEKYLAEAIDSVYAQTYTNWEIIFWDNASSDSSAEIAKSYNSRLKYFRGNTTIPLGAARNRAIEKAKGEFLAFLDCDDYWLPLKLEKQAPLFNDPAVGLVYSNNYYLNESSKRFKVARKRPSPSGKIFRYCLTDYCLNMQTVMIRNFPSISFNESLTVSEEFCLFMMILYEYDASYIHEPLAVYRHHADMISNIFIHYYPQEMITIIKLFDDNLSGFKESFREERKYLLFKVNYWKARSAMKSGNQKLALQYLYTAEGGGIRRIILMIIALLGNYAWNFTHKLTHHYH